MKTDIVIIGSGPVGIFTAFQAGMLGMKSCIIDALEIPGGQCSALYPEKPIYDIPAYPQIIAQELIDNLVKQAKTFDPKYLMSRKVIRLEQKNNEFTVTTDQGDIISAKAVIISAGAGAFGPNRPPLKDIESYEKTSVFYFISNRESFAGKKILIAGGGDSALDWAISLSSIAQVSIVHRRAKFRAAPSTVAKIHELAELGTIDLITNFQLSELKGKDGELEEVILADLDGNKKHIKTDILLPFFGLSQNLAPLNEFGLEIKNQHIKSNYPYFESNIPGIYAVGDVATYEGKLKLILTGFSEASSALHHVYSRVFDGKALHFEHSTTKGIQP
ncbi:MAG: NAD(P)/FAD-dependent oxidoreductase [Rickettsiaceae bacterium]|nr:NAD(P)/FAD-dependent oxidoreductase [Rickettsiaceae bacterium]